MGKNSEKEGMEFLKQNILQRRTEIKNYSNEEAFNVPRTPSKAEHVLKDKKCAFDKAFIGGY